MSPCTAPFANVRVPPSSQRSLRAPRAIHSFISSETNPTIPKPLVLLACTLVMASSSSSMAVGVPFRAYHHPESWLVETKPMRRTRASCTKFIERQVIRAWKRVTGATRRPQRTSVLMKDFVLVTSRRRSVMFH
ncbi:hypothetical protein OG21DRAFT_1507076 [Imleria badia]|nr:hypothetical protein OG21DRAFT_1507076 [Imleria badia]